MSDECSLDREIEKVETQDSTSYTAFEEKLSGWEALDRAERKRARLRARRLKRKKDEQQRLAIQLRIIEERKVIDREMKAAAAYKRRRKREEIKAQKEKEAKKRLATEYEIKRQRDRKAHQRVMARDISLRHCAAEKQRLRDRKECLLRQRLEQINQIRQMAELPKRERASQKRRMRSQSLFLPQLVPQDRKGTSTGSLDLESISESGSPSSILSFRLSLRQVSCISSHLYLKL